MFVSLRPLLHVVAVPFETTTDTTLLPVRYDTIRVICKKSEALCTRPRLQVRQARRHQASDDIRFFTYYALDQKAPLVDQFGVIEMPVGAAIDRSATARATGGAVLRGLNSVPGSTWSTYVGTGTEWPCLGIKVYSIAYMLIPHRGIILY